MYLGSFTVCKKNSLRDVCRSVSIVPIILAVCTSPLAAFGDSGRLHDIPIPPNATSQTVAVNVLQHGHRLSMAVLNSAGPIETLLEFYRELWDHSETELPGYIENVAGDWHIISNIDEGWNRVVQMRNSAHGVEAYLSVMQVKPTKSSSQKALLPREGVLVSSLSGEQFSKPTQTDVVFSKQREDAVAGFYRHLFSTDGWDVVSDRTVEGSIVMLLQRDGAQAEVVVTAVRNGSVTVVNKVGDYE